LLEQGKEGSDEVHELHFMDQPVAADLSMVGLGSVFSARHTLSFDFRSMNDFPSIEVLFRGGSSQEIFELELFRA